jgi:hypothetical protein
MGSVSGRAFKDARFDAVDWVLPKEGLTQKQCRGVGCCAPERFCGYAAEFQKPVAEAVPRWTSENRPSMDTSKPANGTRSQSNIIYNLGQGFRTDIFVRRSAAG